MSTVFADLVSSYNTWPALSAYLKSFEGGQLRIDDFSTAENPYAIIRYVKGTSDLQKKHVRAFRSVVWDTLEHRPVSVTPFKSNDGESLPTDDIENYSIDHFYDGVLIGMWWDKYNGRWRIHTRSTLDANCRYYSQTSFAEMFWNIPMPFEPDRNYCYSWILQHPENRIVVPIRQANIRCIQQVCVLPNNRLEWVKLATSLPTLLSWADVITRIADWSVRFNISIQGIHVTGPDGMRWKVRTSSYNAIRKLRGNTPRRDYIWLDQWKQGKLGDYLKHYPEERQEANRLVDRLKQVTSTVYNLYVDAFKAHSLERNNIPTQLRTFVYGLHNKFLTELKPQNKTVDWKVAVEYMNTRDVPLLLYTLNYETRHLTQNKIPIEQCTVSTLLFQNNLEDCDENTQRDGAV